MSILGRWCWKGYVWKAPASGLIVKASKMWSTLRCHIPRMASQSHWKVLKLLGAVASAPASVYICFRHGLQKSCVLDAIQHTKCSLGNKLLQLIISMQAL